MRLKVGECGRPVPRSARLAEREAQERVHEHRDVAPGVGFVAHAQRREGRPRGGAVRELDGGAVFECPVLHDLDAHDARGHEREPRAGGANHGVADGERAAREEEEEEEGESDHFLNTPTPPMILDTLILQSLRSRVSQKMYY